MKPNEAKKIVSERIADAGLPEHKLTARTIGFSDLARARTVFVTVHNFEPHPAAQTIKGERGQGFIVEFD